MKYLILLLFVVGCAVAPSEEIDLDTAVFEDSDLVVDDSVDIDASEEISEGSDDGLGSVDDERAVEEGDVLEGEGVDDSLDEDVGILDDGLDAQDGSGIIEEDIVDAGIEDLDNGLDAQDGSEIIEKDVVDDSLDEEDEGSLDDVLEETTDHSLDEDDIEEDPLGVFVTDGYDLGGRVWIEERDDGRYLVFSDDFYTQDGPGLRIYLSTEKGTRRFFDLGAIKELKGSMEYALPDGLDLEVYEYVLIWCNPARVLFGSARI